MTPRERVLTALDHAEPDRVPVDYWATSEVTESLKARLGCASEEELLRRLGVDVRYVPHAYCGPELPRGDDWWVDMWGVKRRRVAYDGGHYDEVVEYPLAAAESSEDLDGHAWPDAAWYDFSGLPQACAGLKRFALANDVDRLNRTCVVKAAEYLVGMEKLMMDMALRPEFVEALFGRIARFYLDANERLFKAAGGALDIFYMGDDFGTQMGLLVSPAMWRDLVAPHMREFCRQAHDAGLKVLHHTCGAVADLVDDLVDVGVDILNPVQTTAAGMDPGGLKSRFGDRVCFHGSMDTQGTLPKGTPEDVRAEVRSRVETLGAGGGFILLSTHNIQPDVPYENIIAMYEEATGLDIA